MFESQRKSSERPQIKPGIRDLVHEMAWVPGKLSATNGLNQIYHREKDIE